MWTASSDRDGKERALRTKILCRSDARIGMDRGMKRHRPTPEYFTGYSGQQCPLQTGLQKRGSAVRNSQQNSFYEKNKHLVQRLVFMKERILVVKLAVL